MTHPALPVVYRVRRLVNAESGRCDLEINGEVVLTLWAPDELAKFDLIAWIADGCLRRGLTVAHTIDAITPILRKAASDPTIR